MRRPVDPGSDLFAAAALPPGLTYQPEFLGAAEEERLLTIVRALPLAPAPYKQYTARRRIVAFGGKYDFGAQRLDAAPAVPKSLWPLRERVAAAMHLAADELAQVLVTEYEVGTPLGWHRDTPEFGAIAGVSLAADCRMRWRRYPPVRGAPVLDLQVANRSLYIMRDEARWGWQHSVAPTNALRYSITLRTLRNQ